MSDIEARLRAIEERNNRVEGDKVWETSATRRLLIALVTYFTATALLAFISAPHPLSNALVPTAGYILSTLSLPWARRWWMAYRA